MDILGPFRERRINPDGLNPLVRRIIGPREQFAPGIMRKYFSYGSNMVTSHMAVRCPDSQLVGIAILDGFRFIIASTGYASVVPQPSSAVWGVVWAIGDDDERELDIYEAVGEGLYDRTHLPVRSADDDRPPEEVLVYVSRSAAPGVADRAYVESVVEAACAHGFPKEYIDFLRTWMPREA